MELFFLKYIYIILKVQGFFFFYHVIKFISK
jgi:hypothetical protein